jgi:multidrug efflux pump subunit AcrA (membrane-fusion protein)
VGLTDPSPAFRLGAAVTGSIKREDKGVVAIPTTAILRTDGETAAWIVDPKTKTVSLRKLQLLRADPANAVVGKGLELGEIVVTAGVNQLREGQPVRLIGVES